MTQFALGGLVAGVRHLVQTGGVARLLARLPGIGERARIYELSRLYLTLEETFADCSVSAASIPSISRLPLSWTRLPTMVDSRSGAQPS